MQEEKYYIYVIKLDNEKKQIYIGSTKDIKKRMYKHKNDAKNKDNYSIKFDCDFKCKELDVVNRENRFIYEEQYIDYYKQKEKYEILNINNALFDERKFDIQYREKYRLNSKEYYQKNKEEIYKEHLEYYKENREQKRFYCECCDINCRNNNELENHLKTKLHEKNKINPNMIYDCEYCKKEFKFQSHLKTHQETKKHKKMVSIPSILIEEDIITL